MEDNEWRLPLTPLLSPSEATTLHQIHPAIYPSIQPFMCVCQPSATHIHRWFLSFRCRIHQFCQWMKWDNKNKLKGRILFTSLQTKGVKQSMNNNEDNNAVILTIWMPVRGVWVCLVIFVYILIPSCWLSWDRVFLIRRAVSRAAPLAYQHSLIIFAITRKACRGERRQ